MTKLSDLTSGQKAEVKALVDQLGVDAAKLVGGAAAQVARRRAVPSVAFAGDSFYDLATNTDTAPIAVYNTNMSAINWLRWRFGNRMYTDQSLNTAIGGTTTTHLLNTQLPQIFAKRPSILLINSGTNDNGVLTAAQSTDNIKAVCAACASAGISVIWNGVIPQATWSTTRFQQMAEFNRQLYLASINPAYTMQFVDMTTMQDFAVIASAYTTTSYLTADGVHLNIGGSIKQSSLIEPVLDTLLPASAGYPVSNPSDYYDPTLNPTGNILKGGGLLSGTAGTPGVRSEVSGTLATYWSGGFASTSATTMSVAFSKGTDATYLNLPTQIITLGGTADTNTIRMEATDINGNPLIIPPGIAAGDSLVAEGLAVSWTGLTNVSQIILRTAVTQGGSTYDYQDGANNKISGNSVGGLPANSPFPLLMRTPALPILTGFSNIRCRLEISAVAVGQPIGGVITLRGGIGLRKAGLGSVSGA